MADVKISELPAAITLDDADVVPVVQGGVTKKAPLSLLPSPAALETHRLDTTDVHGIPDTAALLAHTHIANEGEMPRRVIRGAVMYGGAGTTPAYGTDGLGTGAMAVAGTSTIVLPAGDAHFANHATTTTLNTVGSMATPAAGVALFRSDPTLKMRYRTGPDVTNVRLWVGMTSVVVATHAASATPTGDYAAFRYDTVADGTAFWRCVTSDSAGQTVVETTVAVVADTPYNLVVVREQSASRFYIDGVLVATITTDIPDQAAIVIAIATVTNLLGGTAKSLRWSRFELLTN